MSSNESKFPIKFPIGESPWTSGMPSPNQSNPTGSNPMRPKTVNHWVVAVFNAERRRGLQEEFYKFAQKGLDGLHLKSAAIRSNEKFSWDLLLRDKREGTYLTATLLTLWPDKVICLWPERSINSFVLTKTIQYSLPVSKSKGFLSLPCRMECWRANIIQKKTGRKSGQTCQHWVLSWTCITIV